MTVDINDLIDILATLCDDENLRVSVKESLKSGLIAGTMTTVGGILAGPAGVAIGGIIGAAGATYYATGRLKPLSQVLYEMPKDQKQKLYDKAITIIQKISIEDVALLMKMIQDDAAIRKELLLALSDHVSSQMHLQIID